MTITKICAGCKLPIDVLKFSKNSKSKDGLVHNCKSCASKVSKKWYNDNKARAKTRVYKWRILNHERLLANERRRYKKLQDN